MFCISGPLSLQIFDPLDGAAEPQRAQHSKYFYEKLTETQLLRLLVDLTHEEDSSPGPKDVDDVVGDHLGKGINTSFLPQSLIAGSLIFLQLLVVDTVWSLRSSAG